jgi:hypothetical protein
MKAHCPTCMATCESACCTGRVCLGLEYDVRVLPDGQEVIGCDDVAGQYQVRACCVRTARELLGL